MKKRVLFPLLVVGALCGIGLAAAYEFSMSYTGTDEFCLSCHNHAIPHAELQRTAHYANRHGVVAGCADCHIPNDFTGKLLRKIEAAREVYGHFTGVIDTEAKYLAHRDEMKAREIARLKKWDSAPCKSCHVPSRMDHEAQSALARDHHINKSRGKTCIDCHQGIAHTPVIEEDNYDF